jgi:hypothetical protein
LAAHWRAGVLVLVTTLLWCAHYDRWTAASWSIPTDYQGDSLEILTRIAATMEGDAPPLRPQVISRLGAPHGANWSAYPSSDLPLVWGIGQVARVIGLFPAVNLALLLATVTSALAFYGCTRWLRARWEWAFAGALLFAFTVQTFQRGLPHLFLVFSWTVPMALLTCALVACSRRLRLAGWSGGFCVGTAALIGIGNPYTVFLFLQLLGWALLAQWLGERRRENLLTGGAALAAVILAFAAVESHLWLGTADTAARSPLVRSYAGTEIYALKPLDLLVPPSHHRSGAMAGIGRRYAHWSEWRSNESFLPYLGLVGVAGLVWLVAAALRAVLRRRRLPGAVLPAGWVLVFASVGGLTNMFALVSGLLVFRATNRFSIFISAVVLMFLVSRLSRWAVGRPAWMRGAAALLVAGVGLADQLPPAPGLERQRQIAERVDADRELARMLEGRLPPGAMVFQLPVLEFPEVEPPHQLEDYEYFRPYLAARSLRFSYGTLKRRSRGYWQRDLASLPAPDLVPKLERYGFAALYFDRRAYPDRGEQLLDELRAMGRTEHLEGRRGQQVVVLLRPAERPEKPMARHLTFGRGWHRARPDEPRWAYGPASLSYFNPLPRPATVRVRLVVTAVDERQLGIRFNNTQLIEVRPGRGRRDVELTLTLRPGPNRIDIDSRAPAVRVNQEQSGLRAFGLYEASVVPVGGWQPGT